jgi:hypothetical protein
MEVPGRASPNDVLQGTLRVGDTVAALVACRPGHAERVFVDVDTSLGTLRFQNMKLYWQRAELTCKKLDRSWGGGIRSNNTAYWRGSLDFDCQVGEARLVGMLKLDCGMITAEERASLDANRHELQDQQKSR